MAAQGSVEDSFTFVGGLNTEGSFFLTPKNCWKEGDNVTPQTDGSVIRRRGIKVETFAQEFGFGLEDDVVSIHEWNAVGGDGNLDYVVVQVGRVLRVFDAKGGIVSLRSIFGLINLDDFKAAGNTGATFTRKISVTNAFGDLIVTHPFCDPFFLYKEGGSTTFKAQRITLRERDFDGLWSPVPNDVELNDADWGTYLPAARYNLFNQGWRLENVNTYRTITVGGSFTSTSVYPANSKTWFYGRNTTSQNFDPVQLNRIEFGTTPAPKGKVILDVFNQVREVPSWNITSLSTSVENIQDRKFVDSSVANISPSGQIINNVIKNRPRACGFFAGRVFYAGIENAFENGKIYFSQVVTNRDKFGLCFQKNDPTSEILSDIEDDDGGTIIIPDAGEVVAIRALNRALVVFATNGVWTITGGDNGFKASAYIVSKVSSVNCISATSIVDVEGSFVFWGVAGIFAMMANEVGEAKIESISDASIRTFYNNIPASDKANACGVYDKVNKRIEWLYGDNKVLCFNVQLQAWYTYTFSGERSVRSLFVTKQLGAESQDINVKVGDLFVFAGADPVVSEVTTTNSFISSVKYLVRSLVPAPPPNENLFVKRWTFAEVTQPGFLDWGISEQPAYVLTGYELGGVGPARNKTAGYLSLFLKRTETGFDSSDMPINPSGCFLQTRWDFNDNAFGGKWSDEYQVYRQPRPFLIAGPAAFDDANPLVISKNKIRGRGKALQIKLQADAGKDMQIVGWSTTFIGNTNV
jgi:hypothetical protein